MFFHFFNFKLLIKKELLLLFLVRYICLQAHVLGRVSTRELSECRKLAISNCAANVVKRIEKRAVFPEKLCGKFKIYSFLPKKENNSPQKFADLPWTCFVVSWRSSVDEHNYRLRISRISRIFLYAQPFVSFVSFVVEKKDYHLYRQNLSGNLYI